MPNSKPSVIERARAALGSPYAIPTWRVGNPQWQMINFESYVRDGFERNSLIYSAVMYKAKAIAQVMLHAYKGTLDEPEPLYMPHPLAAICLRPNPSMSMPEFLATQEVYLNLSGNAYTYVDRANKNGPVTAIYPLRPDKVKIIPNKDGSIKGYVYGDVPFLPETISHIKLPNPGDELDGNGYGLPPISAAAQNADTDNMITRFIHKFFEQGAVIPGLLKFNVPLSPEIVQRRNESRILAPFGVPPILIGSRLGLMRSTYANYKEARQAFWEDTMSFELALFEGDLLYYLRTDDGGFTMFDTSGVPALRKDVGTQVTAFMQLFQNGIPKREAARQVGLEIDFTEIGDADTVYMPMSLYPVGNVGAQAAPSQDDEMSDAPEATEEEESKSARPFAQDAKALIWKAIDRTAQKWEPKFRDGANRSFDRDKRAILAALNAAYKAALRQKASVDWGKFGEAADDYLDGKGEDGWRATFTPLMRGVITDQNDQWAARLGLSWDTQNYFARDWFNAYVLKFAQEINNTTKSEIAAIIANAQAQGWSVKQMQDALEFLFERYVNDGATPPEDAEWYLDRLPPYRTEMIARTETIRSSNAGSQELFGEWGVQGVNEAFDVGGEALMYPGDPSGSAGNTINCRCTVLPVMD